MSVAFIAYFSTGAAAYITLYVLLKRAGFCEEARALVRRLLVLEYLLFGLLLWPVAAALILARYWELMVKRKRVGERVVAKEREGQFSDLSMDALLEGQQRLLRDAQDKKGRESPHV